MSVAAPELTQHAHDVVERLSAAIDDGRSAAHLQLICSELFEALRAEYERVPAEEKVAKDLLSTAIILCKRAGDPALSAQLRLAQLRATVALLHCGLPSELARTTNQPRFRVIQGGKA